MEAAIVTAVLTAGTQALSLFKAVSEVVKTSGRPEAAGKLVEAQVALMDLLQKQQLLIEDNRTLRDRVRELEDDQRLKDELVFHYDVYWRTLPGGGLDGPFSPNQWDLNRKLVRLRNFGRSEDQEIAFYDSHSQAKTYIPISFLQEHNVQALKEVEAREGRH